MLRAVELLAGAGAVVVIGEPGVGKTALVRETATRLERPLLEAGALSTLSWAAYLPIRRALGRELHGGDAAFVAGELEDAVSDGILLLDDLQWADRETRRLVPLLVGRVTLAIAVRLGDPASAETLEEAKALGLEELRLEPLSAGESAELVAARRPDLGDAAVADIVHRSGGNPLFLEELSEAGERAEGLRRALSARVRALTPRGRRAFSLVALASRPVAAHLLDGGDGELVEAGLVHRHEGSVAIRHTLIAESAVSLLEDEERRQLHARLAAAVPDPGEAARHYAAAGDRREALATALVAANAAKRAGERAAHLRLAAEMAVGREAAELQRRAARALSDAGEHDEAVALLGAADPADPAAACEARLIRARAAWADGEPDRAHALCDDGLAIAPSGDPVTVLLHVEQAQMVVNRAIVRQASIEAARDRAELALASAREQGIYEAAARRLVGSARLLTQERGWERQLRLALRAARTEDDLVGELGAARTLAFGLVLAGRPREVARLATTMAATAVDRRLGEWEGVFLYYLTGAHWHAGALGDALAAAQARARRPGGERSFYLVQVLTDLGRHDQAQEHAERLLDGAGPDWYQLGESLWALADVHFAGGRYRQAVAAADRALDEFGTDGPTAFLQVTRAWARFELGLEQDAPMIEPMAPILEAAPVELDAIDRLAAGRHASAAAAFATAADAWRGRHFRGELRCLWAHGEALRRAGDASARGRLEEAEALAERHEAAVLLERIRRSLRLAGARRSAPRSRALLGLTGREHDVLSLVGEGLSNAEIAARLGLGRSSVARTLANASRKLGATTRAQAASMAARRSDA